MFKKFKGKLVAVQSAVVGAALVPMVAMATPGDYDAFSDSITTEWTAGRPVVLAIMAIVIAAGALFLVFRKSKRAVGG